MKNFLMIIVVITSFNEVSGQTNPLWIQEKVKNYLLHMIVPEVGELVTKTDIVIIPIAAMGQHGKHLPIGN